MKKRISFKRAFAIFSGVKIPWFLLATLFVGYILVHYLTLRGVYITSDVLDEQGNVQNSLLWSYVAFTMLSLLCSVYNNFIRALVVQRVNKSVRKKVWKKLMYIPQRIYENDGGEKLVSTITSDCENAGNIFANLLAYASYVILIPMYLREMVGTDTRMALYMLLLIPVSVLLGLGCGKLRYWVSAKTQRTLANSTAYMIERVKNRQLIKAANSQNVERQNGDKAFTAQYKVSVANYFVGECSSIITYINTIGSVLIPFVVGGVLVKQGVLTTGDVVAFYMVTDYLSSVINGFATTYADMRGTIGALNRVVDIEETAPEDVTSGRDLDVHDSDISFSDVAFRYTDETHVINSMNCVIPKNKVTAIIGANGSGKTTFLRLLERIYEPDHGEIRFGDHRSTEFNLHSWRKTFATVAQDNLLMEGTIRSNITFGCERPVADSEIWQVCRLANIETLVRGLPHGLDSYVAPGGRNFSGGQCQCISIARAIMNNPDFLLLDEPTSNLDSKHANTVTESIQRLMEGRTTVIIAHNLAAIRYANNILIMKDGQIIAQGAPEEIIQTSEEYRQFVLSQQKRN